MAPWLSAITDSLEALHHQDVNTSGSLSYIMEKANIQFKSVNFMRGRSIKMRLLFSMNHKILPRHNLRRSLRVAGKVQN